MGPPNPPQQPTTTLRPVSTTQFISDFKRVRRELPHIGNEVTNQIDMNGREIGQRVVDISIRFDFDFTDRLTLTDLRGVAMSHDAFSRSARSLSAVCARATAKQRQSLSCVDICITFFALAIASGKHTAEEEARWACFAVLCVQRALV